MASSVGRVTQDEPPKQVRRHIGRAPSDLMAAAAATMRANALKWYRVGAVDQWEYHNGRSKVKTINAGKSAFIGGLFEATSRASRDTGKVTVWARYLGE